jgi:hypothetical protein
LLQTYVTQVQLKPVFGGTASLPYVDFNAMAGHAAYTRSSEFQVIVYRPEEASKLLKRYAYKLDVVSGEQPPNAIESPAHIRGWGSREFPPGVV